MTSSIKITRPNRLAEDGTLTSFEDWKNNFNFYLSQENNFKKSLKSNTAWTKARAGSAHRGLSSSRGTLKFITFPWGYSGIVPSAVV